MQWLIALVAACLCFSTIQHFEDKKQPPSQERFPKNKIILFFFIVVIFQIVFHYLDLSAILKTRMPTFGGSAASATVTEAVTSAPTSSFTKEQQSALEYELLRGIHQDISYGSPPF